MKREYPQILDSTTEPHDVVFIPESYLYGGLTEKVFFNNFLLFLRYGKNLVSILWFQPFSNLLVIANILVHTYTIRTLTVR